VKTCTPMQSLHPFPLSQPQSTYRGRDEIGGVYLPSQLRSVHYNFVLDGRYSERGWVNLSEGGLARLIGGGFKKGSITVLFYSIVLTLRLEYIADSGIWFSF
jgi:hypothetical protein